MIDWGLMKSMTVSQVPVVTLAKHVQTVLSDTDFHVGYCLL
jgi:hypothetical protein